MMMRVRLDTVSSQKHQSYARLAAGNSLSALQSSTDIGLWTYVLNFRVRPEGDKIAESHRGGRRPS